MAKHKNHISFMMDPPFEHIEIDVTGWRNPGDQENRGYMVGIMNTRVGQGTRESIEYAEARARAVLKAVAKHKRRLKKENPDG